MYRILLNQIGCQLSRRFARALLLAALLVGVSTTSLRAGIALVGSVLPRDDPFTPGVNEGLPPGGSFVNTSQAANAQTNWEFPADLRVGIGAWGRVDIDGSSQLRLEDLIIGERPMDPSEGPDRQGEGWVLITGIDALFNNDPNIIPPWLPDNFGSTAETSRPTDEGFDLFVGRDGVGTLEIRGGGRAEIQDLTIVADEQGSTGNLMVDGFASFLGTGGFEESGGPAGAARQMIIGHMGVGTMTISNGGTVVADSVAAGAGGGNVDTIGAVIGGDAYTTSEPVEGGRGLVNVLGANSKWIVGGTLQIGGFDETTGGLFSDLPGATAEYDSTVGRGTLKVTDGGLVSIRNAIDADPMDDQLRLLIGRFGRVELLDGYINVGDPGFREDNVQLINDGVITGGGRIDTGLFRNRYFGEIRVNAGQKLLIDATSEFRTQADEIPLTNFGRIEVIGTEDLRAEIEFERAPNTEDDPIQPFINRSVALTDPARVFDGGLITAQHATLRFRSGILNEGTMVFTEGTNIVSGRVDNITGPVRNGLVYVAPDTTVVFEDDFASGGLASDAIPGFFPILTVAAGGTVLVENSKSLTLAGIVEMELSFANPSKIQVAGDLGVNATLALSFASDAITSLSHGDVFELMSFSGDVGGVDFTDPVRLAPDLAANPVLNVVTDAAFNLQFPNLDLIATPILQSFYLFVLDPSMIGSGGAMGADFNGDGVVDGADLAIWQMNVGLTMGASVLQGDADSDGDVDGDDFLAWQQQIGPVPGGGAGSGQNLPGVVPEPSSIVLLLSSGMLAVVFRRRRMQ